MKPLKPRLAVVTWADAFHWDEGWCEALEAIYEAQNDDWIVTQAGYILVANRKYILIADMFNPKAGSSGSGGDYAGFTKIPFNWIIKIRYLTPKRRRT